MAASRRTRVVVGIVLTFVFISILTYLWVRDILAGKVAVSLPLFGKFTFTAATDGFAFYLVATMFLANLLLILAVCVATPFMLRSKRGPVFEQKYVEVSDHFNPSGMRPLWIVLVVVVVALAYVALA